MTMNDKKTQLLCISSSQTSDVTSFVRLGDGSLIESQGELKQLGFHFGTRPNVATQVEYMKKKFRGRLWMLRHLQKAGLSEEDLVSMYKIFLLSVLDYGSVVYHSMVTKEQAGQLEGLQRSAMRVIYGHSRPYLQILGDLQGKIEPLHERRQRMVDKFILKASENPQFAESWFPKRAIFDHNLRKDYFYHEEFARTTRLYNSPIYYYRRRLNEISRPRVRRDEDIVMI